MIEDLIQTGFPVSHPAAGNTKPHKRFHMGSSDRMAGSVPVWEYDRNATSQPVEGKTETFPASLAQTSPTSDNSPRDFGFYDLLDIINPLQHIPLVSNVYRALTGDEIAPASQIVGGAVFGGFAGAANGIANVIVEHETGKDISGTMLAMIQPGDNASGHATPGTTEQKIEKALAQREKVAPLETKTALGFAPPAYLDESNNYESIPAADGRTAGTTLRKEAPQLETTPVMTRQPITQVTLAPLPLATKDEPMPLSRQTAPYLREHMSRR